MSEKGQGPAIVIRGLNKSFGKFQALKNALENEAAATDVETWGANMRARQMRLASQKYKEAHLEYRSNKRRAEQDVMAEMDGMKKAIRNLESTKIDPDRMLKKAGT